MSTPCGEYRKEIQKCNVQAGTQVINQQPCSIPTIQNQTTSAAPMRPRSVYTAHSYHAQTDETNFQRYSEFPKYFEAPPSEQWGGLAGTTAFSNSTALWRQPRNSKTIAPYYEETCLYAENWREHDTDAAIVATPHGTISLRLHNRIRVDMTIDRAVRVINFKNNIVLSLSGSGAAAALLHPNGRIYQYGSRVEILAHDAHGNNKYAKMWYKGVSFTSEQCALVYLVDTAGTRTTTDSFSDMGQDFSLSVFYSRSRHGAACLQEAAAALSAAQYWLTNEGVENWIINNVRVSQTPDGLVRIARNSNKYQLRTSPSNGTASLTTPFLHCTASLGQTSHLFVRRGERRMHYDGTSFIVRNAGHSAGFDDNNQLKVY
ncbi:wurstfest [Bombus fervidus]